MTRKHALPLIGTLPLDAVRPRHLAEMVEKIKATSKLAPRTIRHVWATLRAMFASAVCAELLTASPALLPKGVLPRKIDANPRWRMQATYEREEIQQLLGDERIGMDRRVVYALKALAGLRHGETAGVRWGDYRAAKPLAALDIATSYDNNSTKTGLQRSVPVHPALAAILAAWRAAWAAFYGREPTPADFIVPDLDGNVRESTPTQDALVEDLKLLGLRVLAGHRNRRGHEMRAWFITQCQADGARGEILRRATHPSPTDVFSSYSRFSFADIAAEVAKLQVNAPAWTVGVQVEVARVATVGATVGAFPVAEPVKTGQTFQPSPT